MSRSHRVETPVPPEYSPFSGRYRLHGPMRFPHPYPMDAQRECDLLCEVQPKGKPIEIGKLFSPGAVFPLFMTNLQLLEVASGVAYLNDLGIVHGDLKGVRPSDALGTLFVY
jgi:hypothetical protein